MSYALVSVKQGLGGVNIHDGPDGDIIDAIEPHGVYIQTVGTPVIVKRGIPWREVTYSRPHQKPERGWLSERCVDIHWQTFKGTVHEAQEEHLKSVSFPRQPPDIPHFDGMPECEPIIRPIPRGMWLVLGLATLCVLGVLFKAYWHIP